MGAARFNMWVEGDVYPIAFGLPATVPNSMTRVPDLSENSVLCLGLCDQKTTKNKTECWPFLWFLSYSLRPLCCPKIIKI